MSNMNEVLFLKETSIPCSNNVSLTLKKQNISKKNKNTKTRLRTLPPPTGAVIKWSTSGSVRYEELEIVNTLVHSPRVLSH